MRLAGRDRKCAILAQKGRDAPHLRRKSGSGNGVPALSVAVCAPPMMSDHSRLQTRGDNAGISNPNDKQPDRKTNGFDQPVFNSDINVHNPAAIN
ncbi:MAG TPA: hypothetical protein VHV26_02245 [Rhizomicrobium sp.]|jgi:hypothetical protein|nr:hypothetical protein [Rhizomicrobium sp.]